MHDADVHAETTTFEDDAPIRISHVVHTVRRYQTTIVFGTLALAIAYAAIAITAYVSSRSQRITSQHFRLEFQGATEGHYPNGLRFSSAEIISNPILLKVFRDNDLSRFTTYEKFSKALFVLANNPEYDRLAAEYQARLADPKLSSVDRERVQADWNARVQALAKNELSINLAIPERDLPESIARKVLTDVLSTWAEFAVKEKHALLYDMDMLSPSIVSAAPVQAENPIIAGQVLRTTVYRVLGNIEDLKQIPGADVIRTRVERLSLEEIRLRLEAIDRFRLEPLVPVVRVSAFDRAMAASFARTQLAFDERRLKALQDEAESIRRAVALYVSNQSALPETSRSNAGTGEKRTQPQSAETIVPQISDTFLDRLMTLTAQSRERDEYRRTAVEDYRKAEAAILPAQDAVTYDRQVIDEISRGASSAGTLDFAAANKQLADAREEISRMIGAMNEIYEAVSRNLNPATEMYSMIGPSLSRVEGTVSGRRLALYGALVALIGVPLIVAGCLIHNRVREEEIAEGYGGEHLPAA